ncbi:MAG TPA: SPFH domain-containing protein [Treponemataceae bacterium]|nr:SPFH domain-containing protein [Treponemataceae bacterium]
MTNILFIGLVSIGVFLVLIILASGYVKAPPDEAYIITGLGRRKVAIGKAAIKVPFFQRLDKITLKLISIDVKTATAVPTADFINISVDSVVNVKVGNTEKMLELAAQNFLNKTISDISGIAQQVLEGNMREIVGKMGLRELVSDRQLFATQVKSNANPDLEAMGLEIVSFNVQNFSDANNVITDLGIDNISRIKKDASIAKANAEREVKTAQAENDKLANDALIASQLEIAKKGTDLEIKIAELKVSSDTKKAEADAAYMITQQDQRKTIEISTASANLAKLEKETEVQSMQVALTEKNLDATIRKVAEANRYKIEQDSDADLYRRQKEAEASTYEANQKLEAKKADADAVRYSMVQEAEGIRQKGLAEAEAIQAKALAEAVGIEKKAEAMTKMGEAAKLEMVINQLPKIAEAVASPLSKVDHITMYGEGNSGKMVGDIMTAIDKIASGSGLDIKSLLSGIAGGIITGKALEAGSDVPKKK